MVGVAGFEPATPRPPGVCATGLRHTPPFVIAAYKPVQQKGQASDAARPGATPNRLVSHRNLPNGHASVRADLTQIEDDPYPHAKVLALARPRHPVQGRPLPLA